MTQPSNVYSTYDASASTGVGRGNREDLADIMYMISPTDTPLLTALPRGKAKATLHEWTKRSLANAAANEKIEGDDATITAANVPVRYNNRLAISNKVAGVTRTQQAVDKVESQDALAVDVADKMAEIKRDMEVMLTANTARVAGDDTTARKFSGFPCWILNSVAVGADPTGDGSDTATDGTQRAMVESHLLTGSQLAYDDGGKPTLLVCGTFNKRVVSGFAGNLSRTADAADKKLVNSVSIYEDDFNTMKVVADRFSRSRNVLGVDPEYAKVCYLRPLETWDLAVTGSSMRKQIEEEWTLEMSHPDAHFIIRDVTTS